jgi:calcium-dependent protein kinase
VFTSTADIHQLYTFGKVLGIGSFGKVLVAKMKHNPEKQYAIKVIDKRRVKGKEALLANEIFVLQ